MLEIQKVVEFETLANIDFEKNELLHFNLLRISIQRDIPHWVLTHLLWGGGLTPTKPGMEQLGGPPQIRPEGPPAESVYSITSSLQTTYKKNGRF